MNFKINSRPLFTVIFQLKNDNFKTRDFSPLIERVLAGVGRCIHSNHRTMDICVSFRSNEQQHDGKVELIFTKEYIIQISFNCLFDMNTIIIKKRLSNDKISRTKW